MREIIVITLAAIFIISGYCAASSEVKNIDSLPSISWEHTFGDQKFKYENEQLFLTSESKELIIAGRSVKYKSNDHQREGVWVWKVNNLGHKKTEANLKKIKTAKSTSLLKKTTSMLICDEEIIILSTKSDLDETILLKINFAGDILFSTNIGTAHNITKIIPTADGNFLLIGDEKGIPSLSKIDGIGKELWSKVFQQRRYGKFVDGIPTKDEGFILIENSGASTKYMTNAPDIFIAKYNAKGEKENEQYLSGRYGNIVKGQNNSLVILYDKGHTTGQDFWVQAYDNNLAPLWNCNITTAPFGFQRFKIAALDNGNYVVAGSMIATGKTFVSYLDSLGVKKWDYISKTPEYALDTDVACADSTCYLVESIPTLQTMEEDIRKIKVIKFQPQ
jgi:hypothetical protein